MNPVKAGMVSSPEKYEWSSHRAYLGNADKVVSGAEEGLLFFSEDVERARASYLDYISRPVPEKEWNMFDKERNGILGDADFRAHLKKAAGAFLGKAPVPALFAAAVLSLFLAGSLKAGFSEAKISYNFTQTAPVYKNWDGVNWGDLVVLSEIGINWEDFSRMSLAGVNWEDLGALSAAGVNWGDLATMTAAASSG